MRLTVLGCYGPYPPAGGACSGYLLENNGCRILLECGNGILSRLQAYLPFWQLDAIFLSHLHADHLSDLKIMRYGLEIAMKEEKRHLPLPLYAPPEPSDEYDNLSYKDSFTLFPLSSNFSLNIHGITVKTQQVLHSMPAFAFRFETETSIFVYSGDTEFHEGLIDFSRGADLFLCEANYQDEDLSLNYGNHLSASQAAQIAIKAGVKKLLLTHHHPNRAIAVSLEEAGRYFQPVEAASEGQTYLL